MRKTIIANTGDEDLWADDFGIGSFVNDVGQRVVAITLERPGPYGLMIGIFKPRKAMRIGLNLFYEALKAWFE